MNATYLNTIIDYIGKKNPMQYKKLKKTIPFDDAEFVSRAETFFKAYDDILIKENKDMSFAVDCYLKMCSDMMVEQITFMETGAYTSTSFDEVNARVYSNDEIMSYHMNGLLVSQYLWDHHYKVLQFFINNIDKFSEGVKNVLEVGGGQGLFTNEVFRHFKSNINFTMVDVSETSIGIHKNFVKGHKVNYVHEDVMKYFTDEKFDFIIMGEVLEHVEEPLELMKKLHSLGSDNVTAFITVPCNSPMIDHIYLFRNPAEIVALFNKAGWEVALEIVVSSENKKNVMVDDPKVPVKHAAFLKKKK
jgi:hypothetical protein